MALNIISLADKSDLPIEIDSSCRLDSSYYSAPAKSRIISVQGAEVHNSREIEHICDQYEIGDNITLEIEFNNTKVNFNLELVNYYNLFYLIVLFITGIIYLTPAIYVFLKNQGKTFSVIFHWTMVSAACYIVLTTSSYITYDFMITYIIRTVYIISIIFTPLLLFHFSFYLPVLKWKKNYLLMLPLYISGLILSIYSSVQNFLTLETLSSEIYHNMDYLFEIGDYAFMIFGSLTFINFIHSYITNKEDANRRKLLWILPGISFGPFVFIFLYMLPRTLTGETLIPEPVMILATATAPIMFFIAIVSYRFVDINILISKGAVLTSILAFFLVIYLTFVISFMGEQPKEFHMIAIISAIVTALIFNPARKFAQRFINKRLFKVHNNIRKAEDDFMTVTNSIYNAEDIQYSLKLIIEKNLDINNYSFYTINNDLKIDCFVSSAEEENQPDIELIKDEILKTDGNRIISKKRFLEPGIDFTEDNEFRENTGFDLAIIEGYDHSGRVSAFLLGEKTNHLKFSEEEIYLFRFLSIQTSKALEKLENSRRLLVKEEETKRLRELNELKSYFVSSVSHELKTPLTSIRLFSELLENKEDISIDKKKNYLNIIQGECDRLTRLVNNILDYSRIEKGKMAYYFSKVDLANLTEEVLNTFIYQLKIQGFEHNINKHGNDFNVLGDKDSLILVIGNLLNNAIKYSLDEKRIDIILSEKQDNVLIEIEDRGIGISEDDKTKIFNSFFRSEDYNVSRSGGAGIGLSLVKKIVDAHRGKINVDSLPGKGSKFIVELPKDLKNV